MLTIDMKKISLCLLCFLCACAGTSTTDVSKYRVQTVREKPYYLSANPEKVEDTCPGHDILKQYNCTHSEVAGATCFDVYMVEGRPVNEESYTLLQENITTQNTASQAACPSGVTDCNSFLEALNYNLEFSWYLVNFPSSSFEQCRETYDCKRIECSQPIAQNQSGQDMSALISCVYKKNQLFFVGGEITCQKQAR